MLGQAGPHRQVAGAQAAPCASRASRQEVSAKFAGSPGLAARLGRPQAAKALSWPRLADIVGRVLSAQLFCFVNAGSDCTVKGTPSSGYHLPGLLRALGTAAGRAMRYTAAFQRWECITNVPNRSQWAPPLLSSHSAAQTGRHPRSGAKKSGQPSRLVNCTQGRCQRHLDTKGRKPTAARPGSLAAAATAAAATATVHAAPSPPWGPACRSQRTR